MLQFNTYSKKQWFLSSQIQITDDIIDADQRNLCVDMNMMIYRQGEEQLQIIMYLYINLWLSKPHYSYYIGLRWPLLLIYRFQLNKHFTGAIFCKLLHISHNHIVPISNNCRLKATELWRNNTMHDH